MPSDKAGSPDIKQWLMMVGLGAVLGGGGAGGVAGMFQSSESGERAEGNVAIHRRIDRVFGDLNAKIEQCEDDVIYLKRTLRRSGITNARRLTSLPLSSTSTDAFPE